MNFLIYEPNMKVDIIMIKFVKIFYGQIIRNKFIIIYLH